MAKEKDTITKDELKKQIARVVLIAPDVNPKDGSTYTKEVAFTNRPSWSNVDPYVSALPGGKMQMDAANRAENDFRDIISDDVLTDPGLVISLEEMIAAGYNTIEREILEELGLPLAVSLLSFVSRDTNKSGWTTYGYVGYLPEKPTLLVKPDSAGTRWISTNKILTGNPKMLTGHLPLARRAIKQYVVNSLNS